MIRHMYQSTHYQLRPAGASKKGEVHVYIGKLIQTVTRCT